MTLTIAPAVGFSGPVLDAAGLAEYFDAEPGYLSAASCGVAPRPAVAAMLADLEEWRRGRVDPTAYDPVVARTRDAYARLVGVPVEQVAVGAQTSALVANISSSLPAGAEVVIAAGDFTSIVYPFLLADGLVVRCVPVAELAAAITDHTRLVVFSLVQSATGEVADADAVVAAARAHGAATLVDLTQAAGVLPVAAARFDATVCHAYKWLCAPRGVAFLTLAPEFAETLRPVAAGWYAGDNPWTSIYGADPHLATDARRFDVSPAWQAFVGAEPAIELFARADIEALWQHAAGLGDALCRGLGIPEQHQAIVTWADRDGDHLRRITAADLRVAGRSGRVRAAFHVWNTPADVSAVLAAVS